MMSLDAIKRANELAVKRQLASQKVRPLLARSGDRSFIEGVKTGILAFNDIHRAVPFGFPNEVASFLIREGEDDFVRQYASNTVPRQPTKWD